MIIAAKVSISSKELTIANPHPTKHVRLTRIDRVIKTSMCIYNNMVLISIIGNILNITLPMNLTMKYGNCVYKVTKMLKFVAEFNSSIMICRIT